MTSAWRRLAERLTAGRVVTRRLPPDLGGGPILASSDGGLKYLFRPVEDLDPTLLRLARKQVHAGDVVWDIGANLGLFAFSAAHRAGPAGRVIAVEPDPWLAGLLRIGARRQPGSSAPVEVVPMAIADAPRLCHLQIAERARASNSVEGYGRSQMGGVRERQVVPATSLDWLLEQRPAPNVVKIDIEGAELLALSGARRLLSEARPRLIMEVAREHAPAATKILQDHRYRLFDADRPGDVEVQAAAWSTLAIPAEAAGA